MSETWYRGQSTQAPPVSGAQVGGHDLGEGVYYTNDPQVAQQYADTRVYRSGGQGQTVQVTFERAELGRVLDLARDPRWSRHLDAPGVRAAIKMQQNYPKFFQTFVAMEKIDLSHYDVVIAEEFVRGGLQMCVRHQNGQASALAKTLQSRWSPIGAAPGAGATPVKFDVTRLTFRPSSGPGNPAGFENYLRGRENRLSNTQAGWAMLGMLIGGAIQALGDVGIERQVRRAIEETHAATLRAIHERGLGALIIIRIKEWEQPDANDMRARALVEVRVQPGVSPEDALNQYQTQPQLFAGPGEGWRMRPSEFLWIA